MGGKKKKGLSNRLAKMSDEERARYLQHRAAIEEEAKRRKEQLIATYMKNKLKREEAFTRLNIAKINEHWHQVLRKIKVKGLKTEIDDLRIWITKIIEIKNSIIRRLMTEIEEAEEQYQINLKSHLSHVDVFLDMHYQRQEIIQADFEQHKETTLNDSSTNEKYLTDRAFKEERYLRTVLFAMEKNFNDFMKEMQTSRGSKLEDYSNSLRAAHETMAKKYGQEMGVIWRDINRVLRGHLARTTQRRHHYIELKHLDERNEAERNRNERRVQKYTEELQTLKLEYEMLLDKNENQIKDLKVLRQNIIKEFQNLKRNLTSTIRNDEKILKQMTVTSNETIKNLEQILQKGNNIRNFVTCCSRLETANDKLVHWAKFYGKLDKFEPKEELNVEESITSKEQSSETSTLQSSESFDLEEAIKTSEGLPEEFDFLSKMEGMWWCCNKSEIECGELRKERSVLSAENRNMKQIIKGVLKDAALETPPPKEICFPVYTKIRSAPIRSQKMDLHGLDFLVIDL